MIRFHEKSNPSGGEASVPREQTDDGRIVWWNGVDRFLAGKGGGPKGHRFLAPAAEQRRRQAAVVRAPLGYPKLGNVVARRRRAGVLLRTYVSSKPIACRNRERHLVELGRRRYAASITRGGTVRTYFLCGVDAADAIALRAALCQEDDEEVKEEEDPPQ